MPDDLQHLLIWAIPLAPLLSALITALIGPKLLREQSHLPCWLALAVSTVCAAILAFWVMPGNFDGRDPAESVALGYDWLSVGSFRIPIELHADAMAAIMLVMVNSVSLLVAFFACGYMHGDKGYARFFAAVSLFVFSMNMLVLSGNFLQLFVFWEAVGLCSYLLIGFWYKKPTAAAAAKKAFVVNRIGDFGLIMGMLLIWVSFGSIGFDDVLYDHEKLASMDPGRITLICLLLFLGAMGKSAQFPLHVWLPDAMEGPTPVSALIHAATMVTAGVYLTARCLPLFSLSENAQLVVTGVGAITALIAAITALTQFDLKRVLAYSTVSQLGFLFMALGAGVGTGDEGETHAATAAMFHLFTHAYFKALLFLAAGSVMHAMGDVIDMRRFGGLRKTLPITHWTFLVGAATLAGAPLLSGFWSKDEIFVTLSHATHHESYGMFYAIVFWAAVGTATLTAFYTFRAYFMTFWGDERFPEEAGHHPHEATPVMAWPLRVLAICAATVGIVLGPTHLFGHYLQHTRGFEEVAAPSLNWGMMALSTLITGAGIGLAWWFYVKSPAIPGKLSTALRPLHALSSNKFYFDEIYGALLVLPLWGLAKLSAVIDFSVIDKIVDRVGDIPHVINGITRRTQHGLIPGYALMMFGGAVFGLLIAMGLFD